MFIRAEDKRFVVRRVNVAFMGGVALEPLTFAKQKNIAIGIYGYGWPSWYFLNERNNYDPEKDPDFYRDFAIRLMREKGFMK